MKKCLLFTTIVAFVLIALCSVSFAQTKSKDKGKLIPKKITSLKYGYVYEKTGEVVVPAKYDIARELSEGMAAVATTSLFQTKYGFIDSTGTEVIPLQYWGARNFSEGLAAAATTTSTWGFIDKKGNWVIKNVFHRVSDFENGKAVVQRAYDANIIDKTGKALFPNDTYSGINNFSEGLALVRKQTYPGSFKYKVGFVDYDGKEVIPLKFSGAESFWNGFAVVDVDYNGRIGNAFIDKTGEIVFGPFYSAKSFSCGFAAVQNEDKLWGYIDKEGNLVIDYKFKMAEYFNSDGTAYIVEPGKDYKVKINIKGEIQK